MIGDGPWKMLVDELTARRVALGLSQQRLGERIGVAAGLVNKWECGDRLPSVPMLVFWALALGCNWNLRAIEPGVAHGVTVASRRARPVRQAA